MMKFIMCTCFMSLCMAEAPRGPYPPSGWKPQGSRLNLPNEQPQFEITPQRVEYAGQLGELPETTTAFPSTDYLPPNVPDTNEDDIRVQGLPQPNTPETDFQSGRPVPRGQYKNEGVHFIRPSELQQLKQQASFEAQRQQQLNVLPKPFDFRAEQEQHNQQLQNQYQSSRFAAKYNPDAGQLQFNVPVIPMQLVPLNSQPIRSPGGIPARQYGAPAFSRTPVAPPTQYDNQDNYQDDEESSGQPGIAVANAYSGQYYVLGPKNVLQRVEYEAGQTNEDITTNGYSAQLRYSPVEPIRDPIFARDSRGQLIRIYNKK